MGGPIVDRWIENGSLQDSSGVLTWWKSGMTPGSHWSGLINQVRGLRTPFLKEGRTLNGDILWECVCVDPWDG